MDPAQWLPADEPLEPFDPEGELAMGERALAGDAALAQPLEVLGQRVLGAIDRVALRSSQVRSGWRAAG